MPTIINRRDGKPTEEVLLDKDFILIGRSVNADIRIDDPDDPDDIEERASIVKVGEDYILNDLSASGGMQVNGQAVKKRVLNDRDLIIIGEYRMTFHDKRERDEPVGIEMEAAEIRPPADMARRPVKFIDPFRKGPGGKSTVVIYAVLGALVIGIGFASYQSYVARKAADAQAALDTQAYEEAKRKETEKTQENARAVESSSRRNGSNESNESPAETPVTELKH